MLQAMKFGGDTATVRLHKPGRLWLGLGICLGLILGAFWTAWQSPTVLPGGSPIITHIPEKPADTGDRTESADDRWRVSVHTRKSMESTETMPAAQVQVNWSPQERQCVETLEDGAELWRCGQVEAEPLANLQLSLVVLMAEPQTTKAEELAVDLLTSGSADVVLIDNHWPRHRTEPMGNHVSMGPREQLLVISKDQGLWSVNPLPAGGHSALLKVDSWSESRHALNFEEVQAVTEVWPKAYVIAGDPSKILIRSTVVNFEFGPNDNWIYLGEFSSTEKKWLTTYLEFDVNSEPYTLEDKILVVKSGVKGLKVRDRPLGNIRFILNPGISVHIQDIYIWPETGYVWARISDSIEKAKQLK
ncbi:MAG: hypothetical protein U1F76_04690 [Candidatus Competibacteraceae bacterium]